MKNMFALFFVLFSFAATASVISGGIRQDSIYEACEDASACRCKTKVEVQNHLRENADQYCDGNGWMGEGLEIKVRYLNKEKKRGIRVDGVEDSYSCNYEFAYTCAFR